MNYYIYDNDTKEVIEYYETMEEAQEALESLIADGIAEQEHHFVLPYVIKTVDNRE